MVFCRSAFEGCWTYAAASVNVHLLVNQIHISN
jgi:hypothetical protein